MGDNRNGNASRKLLTWLPLAALLATWGFGIGGKVWQVAGTTAMAQEAIKAHAECNKAQDAKLADHEKQLNEIHTLMARIDERLKGIDENTRGVKADIGNMRGRLEMLAVPE